MSFDMFARFFLWHTPTPADPYCDDCKNADINADVYYTGDVQEDKSGYELNNEIIKHCERLQFWKASPKRGTCANPSQRFPLGAEVMAVREAVGAMALVVVVAMTGMEMMMTATKVLLRSKIQAPRKKTTAWPQPGFSA